MCDGKTLGFRCCTVHDCKVPLANNRAHFCPVHKNLASQCVVVGCIAERVPGFRTCTETNHRALEITYCKRGKALFQLREKAKRAGFSVPSDAVEVDLALGDDEEIIVESEQSADECGGKAEAGNHKLRAYFGCRRTHNEQIIMRPCGNIVSRAPLHGSEAPSAVNVTFYFFLLEFHVDTS